MTSLLAAAAVIWREGSLDDDDVSRARENVPTALHITHSIIVQSNNMIKGLGIGFPY